MAAASAGSAASKEPNLILTSNADQHQSIDNKENIENPGFERTKPPPLDITAAQNAHQGPITPTSTTPRTPKTTRSDRERKIGHRRVDDEGQITYKKIQTSQIMCSIQLGISHSIGGLASKPERDLLMQDFAVIETTFFPNEGSNQTPAHRFTEFRFKTYAPVAFRYFRDLFGIQPDDFLLSMCNEPLRELTNPGASGSIFYLTQDDEFIIKTVQHKEGEFLQKLLPGYYMNLNQNPRTLLPKFFGLYCYQCGGKNIRLVVMNNLLPSSIKMHHKYDLKGSTYKRKASKYERSKPSPTYKDLDFMEHHPEGILLEGETYNALIKTIQRDCRVLESFKIMDYSLLVGIHNLDQAAREKLEKQAQRLQEQANEMEESVTTPDGAGPSGTSLMRTKSMNRQKLVAHSTAMEAIQAEADPIDEEDDVPPGGIPARNSKGERLLLYLGIIDILQSYRLRKKLEHTWKSMLHDGDTVSVHRPSFYSQRFQDFMAKTVFKKIPSLDLPEFKGPHRRFRTLVSSYLALKHSPSRKKSSIRHRPTLGEAKTPDDTVAVPGMAGSPVDGNLGSDPSTTTNVKLPAVLHDRGPSMLAKPRVPPPIPPRGSLRRSAEQGGKAFTYPAKIRHQMIQQLNEETLRGKSPFVSVETRGFSFPGAVIGSRSDIPVSSTPPPTFEEATRQDSHMVKARSNTDPVFSQSSDSSKSKPSTTSASTEGSHLDKTDMVSRQILNTRNVVASKVANRAARGILTTHKAASISHITIKTESTLSSQSIVSESSSTTSGFSSTIRTVTWTPPHSVEGSTPTHTEGTPSFTESSSSGDLGCPTTPVRGSIKEAGGAKSGDYTSYQETEM